MEPLGDRAVDHLAPGGVDREMERFRAIDAQPNVQVIALVGHGDRDGSIVERPRRLRRRSKQRASGEDGEERGASCRGYPAKLGLVTFSVRQWSQGQAAGPGAAVENFLYCYGVHRRRPRS